MPETGLSTGFAAGLKQCRVQLWYRSFIAAANIERYMNSGKIDMFYPGALR